MRFLKDCVCKFAGRLPAIYHRHGDIALYSFLPTKHMRHQVCSLAVSLEYRQQLQVYHSCRADCLALYRHVTRTFLFAPATLREQGRTAETESTDTQPKTVDQFPFSAYGKECAPLMQLQIFCKNIRDDFLNLRTGFGFINLKSGPKNQRMPENLQI